MIGLIKLGIFIWSPQFLPYFKIPLCFKMASYSGVLWIFGVVESWEIQCQVSKSEHPSPTKIWSESMCRWAWMQQTQKSMTSEPAKTWERVNTANRIKGTSGRNLLRFFWRLFGWVPHRRLLRKINICRVKARILLWVKNCSSNGIQRVGVNKWSLEQREVKWESLKGLVLGRASLKIFTYGLEKQQDSKRWDLSRWHYTV